MKRSELYMMSAHVNGFFSSFLKLLKNFLWKIKTKIHYIDDYYIYEYDLLDEKTAAPPKIEVQNGLAAIDDADELASIDPVKNKQMIIERLSKGDFCFVAKLNGKIVSYLWVSTKEVNIPQVIRFPVPDKAVYSYDSYTVPEYRGQGISSALASFAYTHPLRKEYRFVYNMVRTNNVSSIKVSEKFDPSILGILTFKTVLGKISITASSTSDENSIKMKNYFNLIDVPVKQ